MTINKKIQRRINVKLEDIHIRDPYVLAEDGIYYLYGTRANHPLGPRQGEGLDVYTSKDLINWSEPHECFKKPEKFWADRDFFAPEVHKYNGAYYMFASFRSLSKNRATQILRSESPIGPFNPISEGPMTPEDRVCLDGTFFVDDKNNTWIVFCHEWTQIGNGTICATRLTDDLSATIGEPELLFPAGDAKWVFSLNPNEDGHFVTDGPFFYRLKNGKLIMLWSSFIKTFGYVQTYALSESGTLKGPWKQQDEPLYKNDGGHGMIFKGFDGQLFLILHQPNGHPYERPRIFSITETDDGIKFL